MRIRNLFDPRSGMEKIRIRDQTSRIRNADNQETQTQKFQLLYNTNSNRSLISFFIVVKMFPWED